MITIDLQGVWDLYLDAGKVCKEPPKADDTIVLPDSTAHAEKGEEDTMPNTGFMTDRYYFEGYAWYSRRIQIEPQWVDKKLTLFLERTRISTVYIDGVEMDTLDSLCGFHEHDLTGKVTAGEHVLTIRVNNTDYPTKGGHMTSPDTQTNWNGIVGRMELQIREKVYPENLQVYAQSPECVKVIADICGTDGKESAQVIIRRKSSGAQCKGELLYEGTYPYENGRLEAELALSGDNLLWDEYHTNLLEAEVVVAGESVKTTFGIRKLSTDGRRLLVNDKQVFWRGKHDGLVFPRTGYAPMTVEEWKQVFATLKEYGINHYRFHTCCPPDAAFGAADEMGIYMEPELPFWGTIAAPGEEGYNESEQAYLVQEGFRILKDFGNHPSFVMLSMGNELWGSMDRINSFLHNYKQVDARHFYTQGSNNFQFCPAVLPDEDVHCGVRLAADRLYRGSYAMCDAPLGHIQTDLPNSAHNYDDIIAPMQVDAAEVGDGYIEIQYGTGTKRVKAVSGESAMIPQVPVISHEIGQYYFFPDFTELGRYEGSQQPLYLQVYMERMEKSGTLEQWKDFYQATGTLAVDCYRREIEAALRSKELSGFQLLDMQDFPGQNVALVGVLNSWLESKGLISPADFRKFCNDTVILGELESFVVGEKQKVSMPVKLSVCNWEQFEGRELTYQVSAGEQVLACGMFALEKGRERLQEVGVVSFEVPALDAPTRIKIDLQVTGTEYANDYTIWAYPQVDVEITEEAIASDGKVVKLVKTLEEAVALQAAGEAVICVPKMVEGDVEGTYCTDFWNYPMFRQISESLNRKVPTGTLGLYVHPDTKLTQSFPCETYSTPQWYQLVMHSHCVPLEGKTDVELLVQPIDNVERAHKLGMIYFEKGVLVCTARLWEIKEYPEVRAFAKALMELV